MDQLVIETVLSAISEPGLDSISEEVADIKIKFSSSPEIKLSSRFSSHATIWLPAYCHGEDDETR